MSQDTCKKIYDTLFRNTDSIFRKLQNSELKLVKMIEQIGNHSFLGFISTFAAKSTKTIKKNNKIHRCYSSCRQINPGYSYTVWLSYRDYYLRSNLCRFTEQGL